MLASNRKIVRMTEKRLSELSEKDLFKQAKIDIGWGQTEAGTLTDFYGSFDEQDRAVVAVEIDENLTFFLPPNSKIFVA
jgi:hypothetical protein